LIFALALTLSVYLGSLLPALLTVSCLTLLQLKGVILAAWRSASGEAPGEHWRPVEGQDCEYRIYFNRWLWCNIKSVSPHGDDMFRIRFIDPKKNMREDFTHLCNLRPLIKDSS
jgi:hypothetical protein